MQFTYSHNFGYNTKNDIYVSEVQAQLTKYCLIIYYNNLYYGHLFFYLNVLLHPINLWHVRLIFKIEKL